MTDVRIGGNDRPNFFANGRLDRFIGVSQREIAHNEAMVAEYERQLDGDEAKIDSLISQFNRDFAESGVADREELENYGSRLRAARREIAAGRASLNEALRAMRTIRDSMSDGFNPVDRAGFEALNVTSPDQIVNEDFQGQVDALEASNDPIYQAWVQLQQETQAAAAQVLSARSRILEAQAALSRLEGLDDEVEGLNAQLEEINAWIDEYNTDVGILLEWQAALQHDLDQMAVKTGELSADAAALVRAIQQQLRDARELAIEAQRAHEAAAAEAAEGFEPAPPARERF